MHTHNTSFGCTFTDINFKADIFKEFLHCFNMQHESVEEWKILDTACILLINNLNRLQFLDKK